jgi:predicted DNA-binding WGR domain protein
MRTFEFKDGKSNKFWNIELSGQSFTVTFGKIGSAGQSQVKKFRTEAAACVASDKLVAEKLRKGYLETRATQDQPTTKKPSKRGAAEVERRMAVALTAIKRMMGKREGKWSVTLFVSHHLKELEAAYWKKHTGKARPSAEKVLDLLELRSHWGEDDEDGMDTFDFTLPGNVTNYVISVRFDEEGDVEDIEMES